jgi:phage baseplate assembly protein V
VAEALINELNNMIGRGVVKIVNAALKMQGLQVSLLAGELKGGLEHFEPYGLTANPQPGAEAVVLFPGGDRSHGIVIGVADRRYRLRGLAGGEVALYDDLGHIIKLGRSGIAIDGGGHDVTIANSPRVLVPDGDVVISGKSFLDHVHPDPQGGNTSPPA